MTMRHVAAIQLPPFVERCPLCQGTDTGDAENVGFIECRDPECGHFWPEGEGKRVYAA